MTVGVVVAEGSCAAREFKLSGPDLTFVQMSSNPDLANLRNLLSIVLGARISRVHARSECLSYFCARRQTNNVFLQGTLAPSMYINVQWNSHMTCRRYFGPILCTRLILSLTVSPSPAPRILPCVYVADGKGDAWIDFLFIAIFDSCTLISSVVSDFLTEK